MAQPWKTFEREIAKRFRRWWPDARRGLQYQDGDYSPDVTGKDLPYYVECKTTKSRYIQAEGISYKLDDEADLLALLELYQRRAHLWHTENGAPDLAPIIVYKRFRAGVWVLIYPSTYFELNGWQCPQSCRVIPWFEFAGQLDKIYSRVVSG